MVIAIDGPAGAGKSTVARAVARALGFTYLDTGAMYRAVGLATLETGEPAARWAERITVEDGDRVLIDGRDVTGEIRTPAVSEAASRVAADPAVRAVLVAKQQAVLATGDWVAEGRDIATVVAPDAAVKVFLTADPGERAQRRAAELGADPDQVRRDQLLRDLRDASADRSVHEPAPDATPVDTTGLNLDEVVGQIVMLAVEAREIGA
jgi:cytidylate kinase